MENSPMNDALKKLGFLENSLIQHEQFYRTGQPPADAVLQVNQIVEPKYFKFYNESNFPFKTDNNMSFTSSEITRLHKQNLEQLLTFYQNQNDSIELISKGNEAALCQSDPIAKRQHFYYCYLSSILNSPYDISANNMSQLIALRKLFMSQKFKEKFRRQGIEQKCCQEPNCPQVAICGSSYCGWHILKDPSQRLYVKCPVCGWPKTVHNFIPCLVHKTRPKPQKKSSSEA